MVSTVKEMILVEKFVGFNSKKVIGIIHIVKVKDNYNPSNQE